MTGDQVNEAQLHAFVDGALDEGARAAVEAHLATHPDDAARVSAYRAQNDALHRAFDAVLAEPHALRVGTARRATPPRWRAANRSSSRSGAPSRKARSASRPGSSTRPASFP